MTRPFVLPNGKHRGESIERIPVSYVKWMIQVGHTHAAEARAELARRGAKAKLTWEDVREIRRLYAQGGTTYRRLAARFGVSSCAISNVMNRKRWRGGES